MKGIAMNAIEKLISVAEAEIGYLEKKSNKDLDDKTANAGSNNYTKYNRDLKAWTSVGSIDAQWCQAFVDWCFIAAFGVDAAKILLGKFTNYTPTGSDQFKKRNAYIKRGKGKPKRGDVIYFYSTAKGRIGHVGIVYKVSGSTVYTIEGNTSGASSLVTNGGGVRKKSYSMSSTYIDGYGSVDYSAVDGVDYTVPDVVKLGDRILRNGDEGEDVRELQKALISLGFDCGSYGADGEFGDCTEMALRAFQKANGVECDGVYGVASHKAMLAALDGKDVDADPSKAKYVQIAEGKRCYVRDEPNTNGEILGVAYSGEKLKYLGTTYENGWHAVEFKGSAACISGKYGKLVDG